MAMRTFVTYTICATSSRGGTIDVSTFVQFEEGGILSETRNYVESSEKLDDNSIMPPLLIKEEIDAMDSVDESYDEPISMEMLEDIRDGSQSYPSINRRESHYKIRDRINQRQSEWKGALLSTRNMGKGLHKLFKIVVKEISQDLPPLVESG